MVIDYSHQVREVFIIVTRWALKEAINCQALYRNHTTSQKCIKYYFCSFQSVKVKNFLGLHLHWVLLCSYIFFTNSGINANSLSIMQFPWAMGFPTLVEEVEVVVGLKLFFSSCMVYRGTVAFSRCHCSSQVRPPYLCAFYILQNQGNTSVLPVLPTMAPLVHVITFLWLET